MTLGAQVDELTLSIQSKGNEIRKLKGENQDVKSLIEELLQLKISYKKMTGNEYAAASSAGSKAKKQNIPAQDCSPVAGEEKKSKNQLKKEKKAAMKKEKSNKPGTKQPKIKVTVAAASETIRPPSRAEDEGQKKRFDQSRIRSQSRFMHQLNCHGGSQTGGQSVTPWDVQGEEDQGIDYDKLIAQFGCSPIDQELINRLERVTGHKAHRYLRRGYFFSHRDLDQMLDCYEKGEKFYLYTGRGPSSGSLHMGHLIPFTFTVWLQQVFQVPLVIQLTDDEKFLFKDQTLEQSRTMGWENARDIIACGFDLKKTFIFANTQYIGQLYPEVLKVQKCVTYNQVRGIFGFTGTDNIGKSAFPAVQAVPSFSSCFPIVLKDRQNMRCLIPQAIDQDPYFRMTRDVAPRLGYIKPALIHSKFFPSLLGRSAKMSGSKTETTIFVSDSEEEVAMKIKKYAFSGGGETKTDHERYGANLDVDIPFQYLSFMLEDDTELEHIACEYGAGRMMSGQVKERLIEIMCEFNSSFQTKRSQVTDDLVKEFMSIRPLEF